MHGYDHHFKEEELKSVGELSKVCSQIVLTCFFLARIGRPDILWSVNILARSITKWTKACDKLLCRLISYIHHTCEYKQYCPVGNTAQQCRSGLFQDSDFAGDLEDSKSTSGGRIFGCHTFVPISWMCKKQTSVSHSSTESEIISLDTGLRQFEKILLKYGWEKVSNWECLFVHREKDYSYLCMWMASNWLERNKTLIRCGKYSIKKWIWENQHLS